MWLFVKNFFQRALDGVIEAILLHQKHQAKGALPEALDGLELVLSEDLNALFDVWLFHQRFVEILILIKFKNFLSI